ncbi:MAG: LytTR family DNA-binding domain-containing protein [Clostridiales bacterium]|nr:LytTR family DNA-binding domain-containing protein [Clostridiales bacterium]
MLTIAICDDQKEHLQRAEALVDRTFAAEDRKIRKKCFSGAEELLLWLEMENQWPDIAILDIEMDGEDGIALAKRLNTLVPTCRIIFLTSYMDYAMDVYEAEHIWFVVKAQAEEYFPAAVKKALRSLEEREAAVPALVVSENRQKTVIPIDRILYLSKVGRKGQVVCIDGEYLDRKGPAALIPDVYREYFLRCHEGYWVNVKMIVQLDRDFFILKNGSRVPISRTFKERAREEFFQKYRIG